MIGHCCHATGFVSECSRPLGCTSFSQSSAFDCPEEGLNFYRYWAAMSVQRPLTQHVANVAWSQDRLHCAQRLYFEARLVVSSSFAEYGRCGRRTSASWKR